ncbi:MAG: cytochrome P450 [Actinomycetota bacterium]|nr:cytochrome P450 [Actinomycetota bacterium]
MASPTANFPRGAAVTLGQLDRDPHAVHARLRESEPVSWLPCLDGWLVTRHDLVLRAMRDDGAFTVDDPRFTTARVIGPSMLSLDGSEHARHRAPFMGPFRPGPVHERFADAAQVEAARLLSGLTERGHGELRGDFASPMAAAIVTRALGLRADSARRVLGWYQAIVSSVDGMTAGRPPSQAGRQAFAQLRAHLQEVIDGGEDGDGTGNDSLLADAAARATLTAEQIVSDAAVLLFGGIETTEGMIANAALMLLEHQPALQRARRDPAALDAAIEESLRMEPAAAVVDRYATEDLELEGASISKGDLVRLSIAAANRDPRQFTAPDRFEPGRPHNRHLAFAQGPHVCVGVHLARLETRAALAALLSDPPRLDPRCVPAIRGLVFRKPPRLDVIWDGAD